MRIQPPAGNHALALAHPSTSIEAYEGSVRSAKTVTTLLDWTNFVLNGPQGTLAMVGRTTRTLINNVILPWQDMLGPDRVRINHGRGTVTVMGREVLIFGADNEASRTKVQGLTLAGAYVDEAGVLPESFFNMLYTRLSVAGAKLWLTANPVGPRHWLKVNWLDKAKLWLRKDGSIVRNDSPDALDLHRYTITLDDNPTLDPEYVERIKRSYSGVFKRRMIDGEWVAAEGAIFDTFDTATYAEGGHVIPWADIPKVEALIGVGIDQGSTNPTSAIVLALVRLDEAWRLIAVNEWRYDGATDTARMTNVEQAEAITKWVRAGGHVPQQKSLLPKLIYADPAAADFREQMRRLRASTWPADNNVTEGLKLVSSLFKNRQLLVADRCTGLIGEAPGYVWDPKATEKGEDKPVKENDHSCDALRYVVKTSTHKWSRLVLPKGDRLAT
jgi:PBSX family phage terminase large subunit